MSDDKVRGITSVRGIKVGQVTDEEGRTGCTVIVAPPGTVGGVDVRGSAPGTRETDLLNPVHTVSVVHAVVLTGGSAYGLDAAGGVMSALEEAGYGLDVGVARVPIVPAAVLFDLGVGSAQARPDAAMGHTAFLRATEGLVDEGSHGAGTGATVGKLAGMEYCSPGGLGTWSEAAGDLIVAALVAVNAVGEVIDPHTDTIIAGIRSPAGGFTPALDVLRNQQVQASFGGHTTIGCIATNARLTKAEVTKVAQMAHDGLARTIRPVHTPFDGDTLFALATGEVNSSVALVGALAADVVAQSVVRAVQAAERDRSARIANGPGE